MISRATPTRRAIASIKTWIDGYADGSSGSVVGHLDPPFAEQKIVHSGRQSMPLDYNNVKSPWYSEAEREWSTQQNWTTNGVDTLVLHVRGKVENGVAPLYAAVEDSSGHIAVVVHPDAAITTSMTWVEWKIPLSQFTSTGVSMTRVKKLYVGLGDRTNPTPGGAGTIYIDDIWIIRE